MSVSSFREPRVWQDARLFKIAIFRLTDSGRWRVTCASASSSANRQQAVRLGGMDLGAMRVRCARAVSTLLDIGSGLTPRSNEPRMWIR
jgi:hypothetical protein